MKRVFFVFILCVCFLSNGYPANKCLTESQVREIVKDVIRENPQLIYNVLRAYIQKEREKQELSNALKHRISGIPINSYNPSKGPQNAPITIIEFTDFQCPFCKKAAQTMDELMKIYPDKIRLVFKNLPLSSLHKESLSAAKAAMAANKQGMFWPYHDMLFDSSPVLNKNLYIRIAKKLGLDVKKFIKDMESSEINNQIQIDIKTAKKFRINATPVFVINGILIKGAKSLSFFKKLINLLLSNSNSQTFDRP